MIDQPKVALDLLLMGDHWRCIVGKEQLIDHAFAQNLKPRSAENYELRHGKVKFRDYDLCRKRPNAVERDGFGESHSASTHEKRS